MKVDKHISDLLYNYDCVIVPELGGFVCNYSSAKIHSVQHTFTPPFKNITFNSNLKNNDGLLANHISLVEKKTFNEANNIIRTFALQSNEQLKNGKKVLIENVGSLFFDKESNIQFDPDNSVNYLLDSFGLGTFRSQAIKREGTKRLEKEFKDRVIIPSKDKNRNKRIVRRIVVAAILLPVIAFSVLVSLNFDEVRKGNYSSLNPFSNKGEPLYKASENKIPVISGKDFAFKSEIGNSIQLLDDSKRIIVVRKDDVTPVDATDVKNSSTPNQISAVTKGTYYIVGGCFEIFENAIRFSNGMKEKGYKGIILEKGLGRLSPVCYSSFTNQQDAIKELEKIHSSTDPNAWLMAR